MQVSIHAPVWGATTAEAATTLLPWMFQSTPPYGGRPDAPSPYYPYRKFQSTPPYGGRRVRGWGCKCRECFNPRPRMGGDYLCTMETIRRHVSIHAPVWGATGNHVFPYVDRAVSIHAPVWGATALVHLIRRRLKFQSTPPYGGRLSSFSRIQISSSFNPRPRMGGDLII